MRYDPDIDIVECQEVYPPSDDTFLLLETVEIVPGTSALEMGCGTGLITCHLAAAGAEVTAADLNPLAVECTRNNAQRNHLKAEVIESDLFDRVYGAFDLLLFNPPYIASEETGRLEAAWAGGPTGVEVLQRFLDGAPSHLSPGGRILLLLSSEMERETLEKVLSPFHRRRLTSHRLFFEELWVEELTIENSEH